MKKRLGAFVEYFPPRLGGDRRIYEIMKNLSQDYDIHFFILPPSYTLFIREIESEQGRKEEFVYDNMMGHALKIPDRLKTFWKKSFILSYALTFIYILFSMIKKMIEIKPHILVINNTSIYTGLMGFTCSKIMNKRLLVEYNDLQALYAVELLRDKFSPNMLDLIKTGLIINEDMIVKNGWRVTAITNFIKNYAYHRETRIDITVIPDGVDTDLFDPEKVEAGKIREKYGIADDTNLCVYAGRIEEAAGGLILLETVSKLSDEEDIKFLIIGEGDPRIVEEIKNYQNAVFTGRIPKDEVPGYLASADVILVPFPSSIASNSISPLKLFEALSMNVPVVASDVNGIREVLTEGMEIVLAIDDADNWVDGIRTLIDRKKKGVNVRNRDLVKENYDWRQLSTKFKEVLES